jgi:hypothetical protein
MPVQAMVRQLGSSTVPQDTRAGGTGAIRAAGFQVTLLMFFVLLLYEGRSFGAAAGVGKHIQILFYHISPQDNSGPAKKTREFLRLADSCGICLIWIACWEKIWYI